MNTDMSEKEIKRGEEILDNWLRLSWSNEIYNITSSHCDEDEIFKAMLDTWVNEKDEDKKEKLEGALIEAAIHAVRTDDSFKHYTHYLFIMNKEWFRDQPAIFDDICKELL